MSLGVYLRETEEYKVGKLYCAGEAVSKFMGINRQAA
ncbi:hypothetical protein J2S01_001052 [Pectinatus haikarae]|uniref:Uncharacterized protein n=1 Tax=Pectinatus haikarae TaxID=349096 RepID=A0ABT9Y6K2_9FIRM|nr:hypothetical protein [Pectinatus haikarae]